MSTVCRIRTTTNPRCVDPVIPNMDLAAFQKPWMDESLTGRRPSNVGDQPPSEQAKQKESADEQVTQNSDSTSLDSGIGVITSDVTGQTPQASPVREDENAPLEEPRDSSVDQSESSDQKEADSNECNSERVEDTTADTDSNEEKQNENPDSKTIVSKEDSTPVKSEKDSTIEPKVAKENVKDSQENAKDRTPPLKPGKSIDIKLVSLEDLDNHTGVLHVWFLVLEGLATTASTAPKNYQPQTLEMLFNLLRSAAQVPGKVISYKYI